MVKSMFAAVAGLKAHQTKMDVISNNIANANTVGYKSQSATFMDSIYSTLTRPSGGNAVAGGNGGMNSSQVGYGSVVGTVRTDFSPSYPNFTGIGTDVYCDGPGFFMVGPFSTTSTPYEMNLSRSGQFQVKNGHLVDSQGNYVYGASATAWDNNGAATAINGMDNAGGDWEFNRTEMEPVNIGTAGVIPGDATATPPVPDKPDVYTGFAIDGNGKITATGESGKVYEVGYVALVNVNNPNGMIHSDGYYYQMGAADENGAAGAATIMKAGKSGGKLLAGYLEGSNVNIAQEFSDMIITQRGYQANTKIITVTDEMLQDLVNMKR